MLKITQTVKVDLEIELSEKQMVEAIEACGVLDRVRLIKQLLFQCEQGELNSLVNLVGVIASESFKNDLDKFGVRWSNAIGLKRISEQQKNESTSKSE